MKHIETLSEATEAFHITHADAQLAGKQGFAEGAKWMRDQFSLHGTDDCPRCQNGRITLYATLSGQCIGCAQSGGVRDE